LDFTEWFSFVELHVDWWIGLCLSWVALDIGSFMPDEEECVDVLRRIRWSDGVVCPHCSSRSVIRSGRHLLLYQRYRCKDCGRIFNDKTGTVFEGSRIPLRVWFFTALMLQYKVSILELSRTLGMYYDAAYRMVKKLRESIYLNQIEGRLRGIVEMDELYVTAGLKGKRG
jgi:transposase